MRDERKPQAQNLEVESNNFLKLHYTLYNVKRVPEDQESEHQDTRISGSPDGQFIPDVLFS